jgi:hypothetical protein
MFWTLRTGLAVAALLTWSAHAAAEEPTRPTTLVGFDAGGRPAWLESNFRPTGETSDWYTVCVAPCTKRVPAGSTFRAAGYDFDPSDPFVLIPGANRVIVTATLTRKSRALPIVMIVVGFASMLVGAELFLGASATDQGDSGGLQLGGVGLALGGAAVGTAGIVLLVTRVREKKSWVTITQHSARLQLPGGFGLEPSGITF